MGGSRDAATTESLSEVRPRRSCSADTCRDGLSRIAGQPLPDGVLVPFYDYDFGPSFRSADESGVVSLQPPVVRQTLPTLVPRVDADGNELAGVRTVLLEVPLGTYSGWNPLAGGFFKGQIQSLGGGSFRSRRPGPSGWRPAILACRSRSAMAPTTPTSRASAPPPGGWWRKGSCCRTMPSGLIEQAANSQVLR